MSKHTALATLGGRVCSVPHTHPTRPYSRTPLPTPLPLTFNTPAPRLTCRCVCVGATPAFMDRRLHTRSQPHTMRLPGIRLLYRNVFTASIFSRCLCNQAQRDTAPRRVGSDGP
jgi:hypothetical protein